MEIKYKFNDEILKKYKEKRSGAAYFYIWVEHDGEAFPEEEWLDFGGNLLSFGFYALFL